MLSPLEIYDYPRGERLMPFPDGVYVLFNGDIARCAEGQDMNEPVGKIDWAPNAFGALFFSVEPGYAYTVQAKASMAKVPYATLGEYLLALVRAGSSRTLKVGSGFAIHGEARLREACETITEASQIAQVASCEQQATITAFPGQHRSSRAPTMPPHDKIIGFLEVLGENDEPIGSIAELDDPAAGIDEICDRPTRRLPTVPPPLPTTMLPPPLPQAFPEPPSFEDDGRGRQGEPTVRPGPAKAA